MLSNLSLAIAALSVVLNLWLLRELLRTAPFSLTVTLDDTDGGEQSGDE